MNAYAMFLADEALRMAHAHADELRDEAAIERLGASVRPARGIGWIFRSAATSIRNALNGGDSGDAWSATIPRLSDYPYRS
jgi:hypothetical protein